MQFVLEICDPKTECIVEERSFSVANVNEILDILGVSELHPHIAYELEKKEIHCIRKRFINDLGVDAVFVRLRLRNDLDNLPYQLHTNRELILMLAGTKPLAVFYERYPACADIEEIPERLFEPYVEMGYFIKRDFVELQGYGSSHGLRRVLYSLPNEAWRIDAYILMLQTASKVGWNEGFERMEGSLLGYTEWQNDAYIEWSKLRKT